MVIHFDINIHGLFKSFKKKIMELLQQQIKITNVLDIYIKKIKKIM